MLLGDRVCGVTTEYHGCEPIAMFLLLWNEFLHQKQYCTEYNENGGASRSITEGRHIHIQKMCPSQRNDVCPFPWGKWSTVINKPAGSWLVPLRKGAKLETRCWPVPLISSALRSRSVAGHEVRLGEKVIVLGPRRASISDNMATLHMVPLRNP